MRKREALRAAKKFVREVRPDLADCRIEIAPEEVLGERRKSWSFGVHIDHEDPRYEPVELNQFIGYVHEDGLVEGLY
jgi:hypothetical protein